VKDTIPFGLTGLALALLFLCIVPTRAEETLLSGTTTKKLRIDFSSDKEGKRRVYRVRNTAHGLKTELHWKDENDTFLSMTLSKCPSNEPCEWTEVSTTAGPCKTAKSVFGYGVNADEFKDEPDAWCRDAAKPAGVTNEVNFREDSKSARDEDLITSIKGVFSSRDDKEYRIRLEVTSKAGSYDAPLLYEFKILGDEKASLPLGLSREAADHERVQAHIEWESVLSKQYTTALEAMELPKAVVRPAGGGDKEGKTWSSPRKVDTELRCS
jgi:hypothetical protein